MSTIKSSTEHLTLNADGSGKDIKFQANGVEKASISSTGAFTSTSIDATKLSGALPAISGAALTNLPASGSNIKLASGTITSSTTNVDINLSSYTSTYERFKIIVDNWTCEGGTMSINKLTASNTAISSGWYGGYYRVGEGNTYGREGFSNLASFTLTGTNPQYSVSGQYNATFDIDVNQHTSQSNKIQLVYTGICRLSTGLSSALTGGALNTNTSTLWGIRFTSSVATTAMNYTVYGVAL